MICDAFAHFLELLWLHCENNDVAVFNEVTAVIRNRDIEPIDKKFSTRFGRIGCDDTVIKKHSASQDAMHNTLRCVTRADYTYLILCGHDPIQLLRMELSKITSFPFMYRAIGAISFRTTQKSSISLFIGVGLHKNAKIDPHTAST